MVNSGKTKVRDELGRSIRMLKRLRRMMGKKEETFFRRKAITKAIQNLQALHLTKVRVIPKGKVTGMPWIEMQWLKTLNKNQSMRVKT